MAWISETMHCTACDTRYDDLLDRAKRDELHECQNCGEVAAKRAMTIPNVSTEKLSATIPEVAAKGRFDRLRAKQELTKARASARATGDRVSEKKINNEIKRL